MARSPYAGANVNPELLVENLPQLGEKRVTTMFPKPTAAVVDNWLLEFACRLIDPKLDETYFVIDHYRGYYNLFDRRPSKVFFAGDKILALLQLIELIVVSDQLVYDADWSHIWAASAGLNEIKHLLRPVEPTGGSRKYSEAPDWHIDTKNDTPDIVRDGAMYYHELASSLGVACWPSPQRAQFLSETEYVRVGSSFIMQLRSHVDSLLGGLIDDAIRPLNLTRKTLLLPGFGSTILNCVNSRHSILSAALELRESRDAIGFRKWLREMDIALQSGDVNTLSTALRDVEEVVISTRSGLGLQPNSDGLEFTIGLSPSIKSNVGSVRRLFHSLGSKKVHVTFLRNHFSEVLEGADLWFQIERLFPEFAPCGSSVLSEERPLRRK